MASFLKRFGTPIFLLYFFISLTFLCLIESVFNGGFYFSIRILWLPVAIVIFGVTAWCYKDMPRGRNGKGAWWFPWVIAAILYPLSLLMAWPYVMAVNASFPPEAPSFTKAPSSTSQ